LPKWRENDPSKWQDPKNNFKAQKGGESVCWKVTKNQTTDHFDPYEEPDVGFRKTKALSLNNSIEIS
jgi:hypothetical protein